jgi:hypothetical protein
VWQSFLYIFPYLLGGTMATSQTCCHLPSKMLNSAAECADRARIGFVLFPCFDFIYNKCTHPTLHGFDPLTNSLKPHPATTPNKYKKSSKQKSKQIPLPQKKFHKKNEAFSLMRWFQKYLNYFNRSSSCGVMKGQIFFGGRSNFI